ncbi:MAG: hypothetical protein HOJ34_03990 [Kordiimonadaceae bacterium]|jgi:hypothetical protein|nr:hypothetical protein [Kordiimonadaceae bacterium]MBT6037028.1 hypothetical protein [Kordiimonadaceae bacterium]MBT6328922.1 hypothetical protein [Kordiimonadaceae bacterium]MBT7582454.1 hypothetical protein [Kordiimonadaceae bacterium]
MVNFKRLNKKIEQEGSNPNRTIHDLVREQLREEQELNDYHLDNISAPVKDDHEDITKSSPVHENIAYAEEKLTALMNENSRLVDTLVYDRAASLLETIEKLKCKAKLSWTEIIDPGSKASKSED